MKHWTKEEEAKLLELKASGMKLADIAIELDRTTEAVKTRHKRLFSKGVTNTRNSTWVAEEVDLLYKEYDYDELEKLIPGKTRRAIMSKCEKLGISKKFPGVNKTVGTMSSSEATLYLVDFGEYKKVGVTQLSVEERLKQEKFNKILDTVHMPLSEALETEREILRNMREFRVIGDLRRGGFECFAYDCTLLDDII